MSTRVRRCGRLLRCDARHLDSELFPALAELRSRTVQLKLWQNRRRASADVKRIAQRHVADLDRRIAAMAAMRQTLQHLADCCQGDQRPDCPIIEDLARRTQSET